MAKTKHNNLLDTIDDIITNAQKKGIVHLYSQDTVLTGRTLTIKDRELKHFGTCGYLGLEQDMRLKQAVIDAVMNYGTQFPMSKTYVSNSLYTQLEDTLQQMFGFPVVVTKNSTLGHITVIPSIIRDEDAVILDQQVHASVQNAVQLLKPKGVRVEIIRHNRLDQLEEKIQELRSKYRKIWYMADGVYSMYGDFAPIHDMMALAEKYEQLHLYVDDAHGMSWAGPHGTGYVMSQVKMHPKMILCATLGKGFGVSGGCIVIPDQELWRRVKVFGGPLTFSVQMEPPMVAAAIASAKIHLSGDIYKMQEELASKISYCNEQIRNTDLPLVVENQAPIFFIGTGTPATGYNFVGRLMNEGYYVNLGVFPAVPVKNTGVRFTVSRHNTHEDIKGLVDAMVYHYPKALADENHTANEVRQSFKLPLLENDVFRTNKNIQSSLILEHKTTIKDVNEHEWNTLIHDMSLDWKGLKLLEDAFSGNGLPEENWDFHYVTIRNEKQEPILASFFTVALCKDDIFSEASVSIQIEEERKQNPYHLTSRSIILGSLMTEGSHFYLNKSNPRWKEAVTMFLQELSKTREKESALSIYLRDFEESDVELKEFLAGQGFVKVDLPESCSIEKMDWENTDEFLQQLSPRSRRHIRYDVLKYKHCFDVEVKDRLTQEEIEYFKRLFFNVKANNYAINVFNYPDKFFDLIGESGNFEFVILRVKPEFEKHERPVAVAYNYKSDSGSYTFLLVGMDYQFLEKYNIYRQTIFRTILRAKNLGYQKLRLGISATIEKKKFGASVVPKVAYVQSVDNYNMEYINQFVVAQK